ncbi:MAG: esterase [Candidatus Marinimicrobia bacterium]|nr:esterase [Candidatus Neomarinimicrobiota bacterium]MCF7827912.1 esterase [Candidatus Neomarinimicrobiota bacterium]MCF7879333.1 esterase [Candidatus Neomarinimicrobiota bacterium]
MNTWFRTTAVVLFLICALTIEVKGQRPSWITSPEIHPDKSVTFRYRAPQADTVKLSAEFLRESRLMTQDTSGIWSITVDSIDPDINPYFFIVDGTNVADPNNPDIFPNERFKRSLLDLPGNKPLIHSKQDVPHGKISYEYYTSESLGLTRPVVVYTPPGYEENTGTKYPVLYLIHGMTDTHETWYKVGRINFILDNLIAQDKAEPMIVVMPYANPFPALMKNDPDMEMDLLRTDPFTEDLAKDVIPYTEENYRTIENAAHRAIAGFSLGGRQILAAGLGYPEMFSYVCAFSPAVWEREFQDNFTNLYASSETLNRKLNLLWLSCGTEDMLYDSAQALAAAFDERGIEYTSSFPGGGHTWMNVRDYMSETAQLLFQE